MKLWLATKNRNKIKEIKDFIKVYFQDKTCSLFNGIYSLFDLQNYGSAQETASSFQGNAKIKTQHLFQYLKTENLLEKSMCILGEDSGLEVESLQGAPGVYSARYSGTTPTNDKRNTQLLLKNMENYSQRKACYVCALSVLWIRQKTQIKKIFKTYCEGEIAFQERGFEGFGYDSVFIPMGESKTFGELGQTFKQKISHRTKALELCLNMICQN